MPEFSHSLGDVFVNEFRKGVHYLPHPFLRHGQSLQSHAASTTRAITSAIATVPATTTNNAAVMISVASLVCYR